MWNYYYASNIKFIVKKSCPAIIYSSYQWKTTTAVMGGGSNSSIKI